jgi:hypothetical protein
LEAQELGHLLDQIVTKLTEVDEPGGDDDGRPNSSSSNHAHQLQ